VHLTSSTAAITNN